MRIDRRHRVARIWSNQQLREIAPLFTGDIVNVSAGEDLDKEGATYEKYFPNKRGYYLTNYRAGSFRGFQGRANEYLLDLTKTVPEELEHRFDIVFNHTVLEHIYDLKRAFANLCKLSRDVVIVVVPFCQVQHENESYEDYWRVSPTCLRRLFKENGLEIVHESANNDQNAAVYLFFVGSYRPEKWRRKMPPYRPVGPVGDWIGQRSPWRRKIREAFKNALSFLRLSQ